MAVSFCGLTLEHPLINGSGTFDAIAAHEVFGDGLIDGFPFSAYVSKTITLEPRAGNPPPRLWELGQGMINSIGLPNKGLARFVDEDLPRYSMLPVPLVVSVMGFSAEELGSILESLGERPEVDAFELNFSCPNVKTGNVVGSDPVECEAMTEALRDTTTKPLIVKLAPSNARPEEVAMAAQRGGADAISLINTLPGTALAPDRSGPWLGGGSGGLSGPVLRPVALAQVQRVCDAVEIPVVGMGGVQNASDALDLISCGATLVAVGTENFRDPAVASRIVAGL